MNFQIRSRTMQENRNKKETTARSVIEKELYILIKINFEHERTTSKKEK